MTEEIIKKQVIPCDVAVIGSGPAGKTAALELARHVEKVALIGPPNIGQETRTTALMMPFIRFLQRLCDWESLRDVSAPLQTMRLVDGTKRLLRAPSVEFYASEIHEQYFGYNIPNQALNAALAKAVDECPNVLQKNVCAKNYHLRSDGVTVITAENERIEARLLIAADGRNSEARAEAGIDVNRWAYPQTALTLCFRHKLPHNFIATEFHTEEGPFTQVPLAGSRSALVWTMNPQKAQYLQGLGKEALSLKIAETMGYILGDVEVENLPEFWGMGGMTAKSFANKRVMLIGETAHLFPPIGAQGLNLTIRDVQDISKAIALNPADIGSDSVLSAYNSLRKPDILFRTGCVHGLNRLLLSDFLPMQFMRSAGLEILRRNSLLRTIFMREGMQPFIRTRFTPKTFAKKLLPPFCG